ncbi:Gly-Xaa carboxypeptidase, partial [Tremellales sp. Uapishka_1]
MSLTEKGTLPQTALPTTTSPTRRSRLPVFGLFALLGLFVYTSVHTPVFSRPCHSHQTNVQAAKCPTQGSALNVGLDWDPVADAAYASLAAARLSKAVQIETVSYDDLPLDPTGPRFDGHAKFSSFLEAEFPKIYDTLEHDMVNTHAHLFTWQGKNTSLKPVLLMAHIDVVPVNPSTIDQWTYPPFEGKISVNGTKDTPGIWLNGRGSSDCKNSLMGIFGAVERLVSEGFQPERTILIANGFDEEVGNASLRAPSPADRSSPPQIGGPRGAGHLAAEIEKRYGQHSISFLVDEGFSGITHEYGATVASLGMAEKGAVSLGIKVETPGGHSSVPPEHTGIGILSKLLSALEDHPFTPSLTSESPFLKYLSCLSEHAPEFPKSVSKQIKNPKRWKSLAKTLASSDRVANSFLATTQAIDLINGGVKINALPEVVEAFVNYRVAFTSSVNATKEHVIAVLAPVASAFNFTFSAFDTSSAESVRHVSLFVQGESALEPAPITSSDTESFQLLAGTCKAVFGKDTIVSPTGMFANTDTKWMWNLTENIYRFTPAVLTENLNQHTVNERISLEGHLTTTRFFYKLIRNTEGWQG